MSNRFRPLRYTGAPEWSVLAGSLCLRRSKHTNEGRPAERTHTTSDINRPYSGVYLQYLLTGAYVHHCFGGEKRGKSSRRTVEAGDNIADTEILPYSIGTPDVLDLLSRSTSRRLMLWF